MRAAFVKVVTREMERNDRIVLILGDISVHAFKECFDRWPERCFNVGICEQAMVSMAAGMAKAGLFPIVHSIAPFLVLRAFEQIKLDFGYQRLPGLFVSVGASFDYATLGCTHHCPEDVEVMKTIEGMRVYCPWDEEDAASVLRTCFNSIVGPQLNLCYVRLAETEGTLLMGHALGRRTVQQTGKLATVVSVGPMLPKVLRACGGKDVNILHITKVAPFDGYQLRYEALKNHQPGGVIKILLVEPYYYGGLAREIVELFSAFPLQIRMIGVQRRFDRNYGTLDRHLVAHRMTETDIQQELDFLLA